MKFLDTFMDDSKDKKKVYRPKEFELSEILNQIKLVIEHEPNKLPRKKLEKLEQLESKLKDVLSKLNVLLTKYNTKYACVMLDHEKIEKQNSELKTKILNIEN